MESAEILNAFIVFKPFALDNTPFNTTPLVMVFRLFNRMGKFLPFTPERR